MKIFNTLTRHKDEFHPINEGKVGIYVCGPTVYDYIHIGNARPMIVFDTVRRYMEYKGYEVNYVSNFTDVDDKIIKKANEEGVEPSVISERYIAECKKDMETLHVEEATTHPQATKEIPDMIAMVETLIEKGYAYEVNGTVYFRTRKFSDYGKLSKKNTIFVPETVSFLYPVRTRRKIHLISYSGSRRRRASHHGHLLGAMEDQAGIWSVRLCRRSILAMSSIFMPVERI